MRQSIHNKPRADQLTPKGRAALERFGEIVKSRQNALGMNDKQMANMLGIAPSNFYAIKTGRANPTLSMVFHLCEKLGMKYPIFDDE